MIHKEPQSTRAFSKDVKDKNYNWSISHQFAYTRRGCLILEPPVIRFSRTCAMHIMRDGAPAQAQGERVKIAPSPITGQALWCPFTSKIYL